MAKKAAAKASRKGRVWTPEQIEEAGRRRSQTVAIRRYLARLDAQPRNGQRTSPEKIQERLEKLRADLDDADPITRVKMIQQRLQLEEQLANAGEESELDAAEAAFIENAWDWAQREGISYAALREVGVPANVLAQAGIARS